MNNYFNLPNHFTLNMIYDALQNKLSYIDNLEINDIDKIFFKECTIELYNKIIKEINNLDVYDDFCIGFM
jgi:hypothetical protein